MSRKKDKPAVTIYHNPRCTKSRKALELIRAQGIEPVIVEYLEQPMTRKDLIDLLNLLGLGPRDILRKKEARELKLNNPKLDLTKLIDKIIANPIVIERPIVVTPKGARICRPPETVKEIL